MATLGLRSFRHTALNLPSRVNPPHLATTASQVVVRLNSAITTLARSSPAGGGKTAACLPGTAAAAALFSGIWNASTRLAGVTAAVMSFAKPALLVIEADLTWVVCGSIARARHGVTTSPFRW